MSTYMYMPIHIYTHECMYLHRNTHMSYTGVYAGGQHCRYCNTCIEVTPEGKRFFFIVTIIHSPLAVLFFWVVGVNTGI